MPYDMRRERARAAVEAVKQRGGMRHWSTGAMRLLDEALESDDKQTLIEVQRAADAWLSEYGNDVRRAS